MPPQNLLMLGLSTRVLLNSNGRIRNPYPKGNPRSQSFSLVGNHRIILGLICYLLWYYITVTDRGFGFPLLAMTLCLTRAPVNGGSKNWKALALKHSSWSASRYSLHAGVNLPPLRLGKDAMTVNGSNSCWGFSSSLAGALGGKDTSWYPSLYLGPIFQATSLFEP